MYRWQTLTLARVEATIGMNRRETLAAVRDILLDIGLRYFPEPEIAVPPRKADDPLELWLTWQVDDREMRAEFDGRGFIGICFGGQGEDGPDDLGRHDIPQVIRWLLGSPMEIRAPATIDRTVRPLSTPADRLRNDSAGNVTLAPRLPSGYVSP